MRTSTGTQNLAILNQYRDVSVQVSVAGSTTLWPVTEFQTDSQMKDTPDQISLLGGVAARQVTFKIDHTVVKKISPYQASIVPAALPLPIGTTVVVSVSFWLSTSRTGTATYTATIFTGNVIAISNIDAVSDITVTAQDSSYNLGAMVALPAAGVPALPPSTFGYIDPVVADLYYSPLSVIEFCLRGCDLYLTAPPVLSGVQSQFTILSVSGYGGLLPDVGTLVTPAASNVSGALSANPGGNRVVGNFAPDVVIASLAQFKQTVTFSNVTDFQMYRVDCWIKGLGASTFILMGGSTYGSCGPQIIGDGAGHISVAWAGAAGGLISTAAIDPQDGAWHHLNVELTRDAAGACTSSIEIDGTVTTSTASGITGPSFSDGNVVSLATPFQGNQLFVEALEIIFVPTGSTYANPGSRNGQTATLPSTVTATTARLQAIAPQSGNAWQTIQQVAAAEGALAWFDEDGQFFFEPRATWSARRLAASVRTFDASMISNLAMSISADAVRHNVSVNYQTVTAIPSTAASPAYMADTVLTFALGYTTQTINTDTPFMNPADALTGATNVVGHSWFYPVDAASVGDPAATVLTGVTVTIQPIAAGFILGVNNPYRYPISFWNPTAGIIPQGPALVIHGTKIVTSDPKLVTYAGNPAAKDDLQLDDNPWRQSAAMAAQVVYLAAMDTYSVVPVIQNIDVPGDPRVQLGDLVTLKAPFIQTPGDLPCVVVDIADNVSSSSDYRMQLGIRPIGPPTGWIAGIAGRGEAGTTTYAPLPG